MMAFGIPSKDEIKQMADDELQKFLDSLKQRETDFFNYLDNRKIVVVFEPKEPKK